MQGIGIGTSKIINMALCRKVRFLDETNARQHSLSSCAKIFPYVVEWQPISPAQA